MTELAYLCHTEAEACSCVDLVAKSFGFHFKERRADEGAWVSHPSLVYVNSTETIKLFVQIFLTNYYKSESCYAFGGHIEFRKEDGTVMCIRPYVSYRKIPRYFNSDVALMVKKLRTQLYQSMALDSD